MDPTALEEGLRAVLNEALGKLVFDRESLGDVGRRLAQEIMRGARSDDRGRTFSPDQFTLTFPPGQIALFLQAAAGLLSLANPTPAPGHASSRVWLRLMAADRETLLVRWLEELHFLLETQHLIPRSIQLRVSPELRLIADLQVGDAAAPGRSIKAVTFHGLNISETAAGLEATVVFDV